MPGQHNALNALAAIAAASEAGIADDVIRAAMAGFSGVKRRFQLTGTWNGVAIYDDYGHHPVEIAAVLEGRPRRRTGRVIAVVEPHRYHARARSLRRVRRLLQGRRQRHRHAALHRRASCRSMASITTRWPRASARTGHRCGDRRRQRARDRRRSLRRNGAPGDMVVCLGAGNSTEWAHALPEWLPASPSAPRNGEHPPPIAILRGELGRATHPR